MCHIHAAMAPRAREGSLSRKPRHTAVVHFVDLAGSERLARTGSTGIRWGLEFCRDERLMLTTNAGYVVADIRDPALRLR